MSKIKYSFVVLLIFSLGSLSAQNVYYGVKGGLNLSECLNQENGKLKLGWQTGFFMNYEFYGNMAFQSGVYVFNKQIEYNEPKVEKNTLSSIRSNMYYLQIPVQFAFKMPVSSKARLFLSAGPYMAMGFAGKTTKKIEVEGKTTSENKIKTFGAFFDNKDDGFLNRFNLGIGGNVGLEVNNVIIELGWQRGLFNVANASEKEIKNQTAYLSMGYVF